MADSDTVINKPDGANPNDGIDKDGDDPFVEQGLTAEDIDQKIETISTSSITTTAKARAKRTASQTIGTGASTKVQFNVEDYDPGDNFDSTTNYRFNVPVDGYYLITSAVNLDSPADGKMLEGIIKKNGSTNLVTNNVNAGVADDITVTMTDIASLLEGDYIEVFVQHDHGADRGTRDSVYLAVHLLSNTST